MYQSPNGPTQHKWFRHGYVAGMEDIENILNESYGDIKMAFPEDIREAFDRITQWVKDNK